MTAYGRRQPPAQMYTQRLVLTQSGRLLNQDFVASSDFPMECPYQAKGAFRVDERHHGGLRSVLLAAKSTYE